MDAMEILLAELRKLPLSGAERDEILTRIVQLHARGMPCHVVIRSLARIPMLSRLPRKWLTSGWLETFDRLIHQCHHLVSNLIHSAVLPSICWAT